MRRSLLSIVLITAAAPAAFASTAADICPPNTDPCVVSSAKSVAPGSTLDFGARQLDVTSTGSLVVAGGPMTILAGSVRLESKGALLGVASGGISSSIKVTTTGDIAVETGANGDATIDVSAVDNPGQIDLVAGGNATIAGTIHSDATTTQGSGGVINVTATNAVGMTGTVTAKGGTLGLGGAITVLGGTVSTGGSIRVDAGDGGDIDIESTTGLNTSGAQLNASGGGNFGDGGSITLLGETNLTVNGGILAGAAGSELEGGGTGGDVELTATSGSVALGGDIDNHGAAPDGDGGEVDVTAGLDYTQTGSVAAQGNGTDSCGGFADLEASRTASLVGDIDVQGGFCGGDIDVLAATVSVTATSDLGADGGEEAGGVSLFGEQITVNGRLHATGLSTLGTGGLVMLSGCTIGIPSGASVKSDGDQGLNLLQASGQLTIGGQLSSRPTGRNRFEYRDPAKPPITLGTASILPTRECAPAAGCLTPTLPACATVALCGNGIRESTEECDDANTAACDGCSPTCRLEGCGNGTIECGEECDDGPSNGGPGDPCDGACHVVAGANTIFVPSSHHGLGCVLEWALQSAPVPGFPPSTVTCVDGDPDCDADGVTDGGCSFHAAACLNVTDVRIPSCQPTSVEFVNLRRPSVTSPDDALEASNAQTLATALGALGVTVRSRDTVLTAGQPESRADRCSPTVSLRVPHPPGAVGRRLLSAGAGDTAGHAVSNRIVLACAPNPAVCGNHVVEIGEQCDDGNAASCDGCSDTCRLERCGDGVLQCGEQCDDGAANGQPGAPCSATCTQAPPENRIPGGRSTRDCLGEWSLATGTLATSRSGLPTTKQICVDNDPACDFDPTPGACRFHLWACVGADDARIGCAGDTVAAMTLLRPSATQTGAAAAARPALLDAFTNLVLPAGPGEVCTRRIDLDLPAGKTKLQIKAEATSVGGIRDRDSLKLVCAPAS